MAQVGVTDKPARLTAFEARRAAEGQQKPTISSASSSQNTEQAGASVEEELHTEAALNSCSSHIVRIRLTDVEGNYVIIGNYKNQLGLFHKCDIQFFDIPKWYNHAILGIKLLRLDQTKTQIQKSDPRYNPNIPSTSIKTEMRCMHVKTCKLCFNEQELFGEPLYWNVLPDPDPFFDERLRWAESIEPKLTQSKRSHGHLGYFDGIIVPENSSWLDSFVDRPSDAELNQDQAKIPTPDEFTGTSRDVHEFLQRMKTENSTKPYRLELLVSHDHPLINIKGEQVREKLNKKQIQQRLRDNLPAEPEALQDTQRFYNDFRGYLESAASHMTGLSPAANFFITPGQTNKVFDETSILPSSIRPRPLFVPSNVFVRDQDCYTVEGIAGVQERERILSEPAHVSAHQCELRLVKYAEGADRLYAGWLRLPVGFKYRFASGDKLLLDFYNVGGTQTGTAGPAEASSTYIKGWLARVAENDALRKYSVTGDIPIWLQRGKLSDIGEEHLFDMETSPKQILDVASLTEDNVAQVRDALGLAEPNIVRIKIMADMKLIRAYNACFNEVNIFNRTRQDPDQIAAKAAYVFKTGIGLDSCKRVDVLSYLSEEQFTNLQNSLNSEQNEALSVYRSAPDGCVILQGPGGSGKTYMNQQITAATVQAGGKVLVTTQENVLCSNLAQAYADLITKIDPTKRVFRVYQRETEQRFAKAHTSPEPWVISNFWDAPDDNSKALFNDLIREAYLAQTQRTNGVFDKRFTKPDLSIGRYLLCDLGGLDHFFTDPKGRVQTPNLGEAVHLDEPEDPIRPEKPEHFESKEDREKWNREIAEYEDKMKPTLPDKYMSDLHSIIRRFRKKNASLNSIEVLEKNMQVRLLRVVALLVARLRGDRWTKHHQREFQDHWNKLFEYIAANKADVLITTFFGMYQQGVRDMKPQLVIVEEAQRMYIHEANIAFAKFPLAHKIFSGDTMQLKGQPFPVDSKLGDGLDNTAARIFQADVMTMQLRRGMPAATLRENRRSHSAIVRLQNSVFFHPNLVPTKPDAECPLVDRFIEFSRTQYGIPSSVLYLDVLGTQSEQAGSTKSSYNTTEAAHINLLIEKMVAAGFRPADILVCTAYLAQVTQLRMQIKNLEIYITNVDKASGREAPIVIMSMVRDGPPGFIAEQERLLTAVSRAQQVFVIVGALTALRDFVTIKRIRGPLLRLLHYGINNDVQAVVEDTVEISDDTRYMGACGGRKGR